MITVSIRKARDRLTAITGLVEKGETVAITRNGRPVADLVLTKRQSGVDLEAGQDYLRRRGVTQAAPFVADDFDAPLVEDFLLK